MRMSDFNLNRGATPLFLTLISQCDGIRSSKDGRVWAIFYVCIVEVCLIARGLHSDRTLVHRAYGFLGRGLNCLDAIRVVCLSCDFIKKAAWKGRPRLAPLEPGHG